MSMLQPGVIDTDVRSQQAAHSRPVTVGSSRPPPLPRVTQRPLIPRPVYLAAAAKLADAKNNVRVLLRDNQTRVDLNSVAEVYREKFGCPLDFVPFGCNTLEQFVRQELADTVHMEQDSTGAYQVTLLRDGGGTPMRKVIRPWQRRMHSTYGARASPAVRRSPPPDSPVEDWEAEIMPLTPEDKPNSVCGYSCRRSPPPDSPVEDWEAEIMPCTLEDTLSVATDIQAVGDTRASRTSPLNPQLELNIKKVIDTRPDGLWLSEFNDVYRGLTGNHLQLVDHGFGSVLELAPHCADIVSVTRPTPEGELREQPPSAEPPRSCSVPPAQPRDGHQQPQRPQVPPLDLEQMMAIVEKIIRGNHVVPPRGRGRGKRAASRQPGAALPGGSGGLTLDALQKAFLETTGRQLVPAQYGFSEEAFVSYVRIMLPAKWECRELSGQFVNRRPGTVTIAASPDEATAPSGLEQGADLWGSVKPRSLNEAAAAAPNGLEQMADLLASPPQPTTRPQCMPKNLWGSVEPRSQGSATGRLEPGAQPRGRALQAATVPELVAQPVVPHQACPPSDHELDEESTGRPQHRARQPPAAAAPGAEGFPVLSPDPSGQPGAPQALGNTSSLVPPVGLEGPIQMRYLSQPSLVYVSHVYSPHHFFLHCMDESTRHTLQWLAIHLSEVCEGWVHKVHQIDVGMPCAAPYTCSDGTRSWLRGIVYALDAHDERHAHVFFVDYGYASRILKTDLRQLKNEFASVPAQAIRATMGHLEPVGAGWSPEATQDFIRLLGKDRIVMCTLLERRGSICSVHLCNTRVYLEVDIPEALVELGHAASFLVDEELPEEPEEPVAHVLPLAEGALAACASSSSSPAGWTTSFPAPQRGRLASPPMSHAVEPVHGASTCDVLRQRLGALRVLERPDLPVEPAEPAVDPLLRRSPLPREPVFSLLPLTSGGDFQGRLDALHGTLTPSEGSMGVEEEEEEPEEHVTRPPLSPEPGMQPSVEDSGRCPRALRGILPTASDSTETQPMVHGPQATVQSHAAVPVFREASSGHHPFGWRSSPSPPGPPSPAPSWGPGPSTGVARQPLPGLSARVPADLELGTRPDALPVHQQGSDAPEGAQPALPPQEEEERPSWQGLPLIHPEPGLGSLYPRHAVKLEYLKSGHCLAVVNLQREPYVTSANVCQLLGWPYDTLVRELQALRATLRTMTLKRDSCMRLFNQMASYEVPGVAGPFCLVSEVTLLRLEDVLDILSVFNNTDSVLQVELNRVRQAFDPASPYWTEGPPLLRAGGSADPGAGSSRAGPP